MLNIQKNTQKIWKNTQKSPEKWGVAVQDRLVFRIVRLSGCIYGRPGKNKKKEGVFIVLEQSVSKFIYTPAVQ